MISALTEDSVVEQGRPRAEFVVRKAAMHDIAPILALINGYAAKGSCCRARSSKYLKIFAIFR